MTSSSRSAFKPISPPQTSSFGFDAKSVFDDDDDDDDDFFRDAGGNNNNNNNHHHHHHRQNGFSGDEFGGGNGGFGGGGGGGGRRRGGDGIFGVGGGVGGRVGGGDSRTVGDLISLEDANESVNGEGLEPELVQLMDSNEDDDDIEGGDDADQDPYSLLAQKERDLILAAELGKALLERNEELQRRNEDILQETGAKIENVEQEKYIMQQNFALKESEFESVITELRGDNQEMQKQLRSQSENEANLSRQRQSAVGELAEQNQRLTQQLREAAAAEEQLQSQVQSLRDQFNVKRSSFNDNQMQMEALKQEVGLLSDRKSDLEKRLRIVTEERDAISASLEEANDRNMILERQLAEEEQRALCQAEELHELHRTNSNLEDRVDRMSIQIASPNPQNQSLFEELDMSSASDNGESGLQAFSHSKGLKTPSHSPYRLRSPSHHPPHHRSTGNSKKPTRQFSSVHLQQADEEYECDDEGGEDGEEEEDDFSSSEENSARRVKSKQKATMESLQKMLSAKEGEVSRLQAKVASLESRLAETLAGAPDEDLVNTREELLEQAWKERDEAVEKQHQLELQLTQAKMDVINLDNQLMEAIHKKIELSQQLERWEIDLETLIEIQVKKKMERVTNDEIEEEKMEEEKEIEKGKSLRSRVARKLFKSGQ